MIESTLLYLIIITAIGAGFWFLELRTPLKIFTWLPAIVLIYLLAIALSQSGFFVHSPSQTDAYRLLKSWLLPMMLFLMMLRLDLGAFAKLGKKLTIAYIGAVITLIFAFFSVFILFGFGPDAAGVFGALGGSWTGGTANMLAVAGAMNVSESQLGPALIVDSLLYTLWVTALLLAVPLAGRFDRWSGANTVMDESQSPDTVTTSPLSLLSLFTLSIAVAFVLRYVATWLPLLPETTWLVLLATLAGLAGSFSRLKQVGGATLLSSLMLYLLIALIGSQASLHGFSNVPRYLAAGAAILLIHASLMLLLARIFKLSLFSIGIASLANIGGIASAPILAAAYNRRLVGAAVAMAVMGYLAGTMVGLLIASGLQRIAG